ncbi:MAG TPA: hypothetical protein VJT79_04140, partial [Pseudonocardia sp.]|nr:hypothetical protein [Pseudonocardia sp.]
MVPEVHRRTSDTEPGDLAWVPALERRLGEPVQVLSRAPLTGGYVAASVERVDLDVGGRAKTVVVKA